MHVPFDPQLNFQEKGKKHIKYEKVTSLNMLNSMIFNSKKWTQKN